MLKHLRLFVHASFGRSTNEAVILSEAESKDLRVPLLFAVLSVIPEGNLLLTGLAGQGFSLGIINIR